MSSPRLDRVISFRPGGGAAEVERNWRGALHDHGIALTEIALLRARRAREADDLTGPLGALCEQDWMFFTSANAVWFARKELESRFAAGAVHTACVGAQTAAMLSEIVLPDFVASAANGERFAEEFVASGRTPAGCRILFLRGRRAGSAMREILAASGFLVNEHIVYETENVPLSEEDRRRIADAATVEDSACMFTNSESVRRLKDELGEDSVLPKLRCFAIGPSTARTLAENGMRVEGIARTASMDSLVEVLLQTRLGS